MRIGGLPVSEIVSNTHDIVAENLAESGVGEWAVEFAEGSVRPDRNLVVRIKTGKQSSMLPTHLSFSDETGDYGLLTLIPPEQAVPAAGDKAPRDVIFLIDQSGSMGGTRMINARRGVARCLSILDDEDRFNVVPFDDEFSFYREDFVQATPENVAVALDYVGRIESRGGTVMQPALRECLRQLNVNDGRNKLLVFMTDGDVGNEGELIGMLRSEIGNVRLFTFGIGTAPNEFLIEQMAVAGRGQSRFIMEDKDVTREIEDLFHTLSEPVFSNIDIEFFDTVGNVLDVDYLPFPIADLFVGTPVQVVYRSEGDRPVRARLSGDVGNIRQSVEVELPRNERGSPAVLTLFGGRWIDSLMLDYYAAKDADEVEQLKADVIEVSILFQIVTQFTSRVAVEQVVSRDVGRPLISASVPNYSPSSGGGVTVGGGDEEIFTLSPFTVDGSEDSGYRATSTLAGTRLRTSLKDVGSAIAVVTKQFLQDTGATDNESLLSYTTNTDMGGVSASFAETSVSSGMNGADSMGDHGLADPIAVERVNSMRNPAGTVFSLVNPFGGAIAYGPSVKYDDEYELGLRIGEGDSSQYWIDANHVAIEDRLGFRFVGSESNRAIDRVSAHAILEANFTEELEASVAFSHQELETFLENDRLALNVEWNQYDNVALKYEYVWNSINGEDPLAFDIGNVGDERLDILAAEEVFYAAHLGDLEESVHMVSGFAKTYWWETTQAFYASLRTHELDEERTYVATENSSVESELGQIDLLWGYQVFDLWEQLNLNVNGLRSRVDLNWLDQVVYDDSWNANSSFNLNQMVSLNASYSESENTPKAMTRGLLWDADSEAWVTTPELGSSSSRGIEVGVGINTLDHRFFLQASLFRRNDIGMVYRDWASESTLMSEYLRDGVSSDIDIVLRNFTPYDRTGLSFDVVANPLDSLRVTANYLEDWKNDGPIRGGNRRANLFTMYDFEYGMLKGFSIGAGLRYRNDLVFNDGFLLKGNVLSDFVMRYEWDNDVSETSIQLNVRNLQNREFRSNRYDIGRGSEARLTLTQRF